MKSCRHYSLYLRYLCTLFILSGFLSNNVIAATPSPRDIRTTNAERDNSTEKQLTPKAEISQENTTPLQEGSSVLEGYKTFELNIRNIRVYGFNAYGNEENSRETLTKLLQKAITVHNNAAEENDKKIQQLPIITKNKQENSYTIAVNKDVYLSLVYALSAELTKKYQQDKYFLSRAFIPAQEINQTQGDIDVCVVEGYLAEDKKSPINTTTKDPYPEVEIKQDKQDARKKNNQLVKLQRSVQQSLNQIKGKKPLAFSDLERVLLLIRDLPGVNIQTTFQQITQKKKAANCQQALVNGMGETRLAVTLELDKVNGSINFDNYGLKSAGPEFVRFDINGNSLFQAGDRYTLDIALSLDSKELNNYGLSAAIPLDFNQNTLSGLTLNAEYRIGDAVPGDTFSELNIKNDTTTSSIGLEYPWIRSRRQNLTIDAKVRYQDIETNLLNSAFVKEKIRTLHASTTYDRADTTGISIYSLEVVKGLNRDGATQKGDVLSSRPEAEANFTRFIAEAKRFQNLDWKITEGPIKNGTFTWINAVKLQQATEPLFASEEFELGGREYGRGFDVGVVSGDRGFGVSTQLNYDFSKPEGNWTLFGFIDHGRVRNVDNSDQGTDQEKVHLTSTGFGVNFQHNDNWYINTELSKPMDISNNSDKKGHIYIGLGYRY